MYSCCCTTEVKAGAKWYLCLCRCCCCCDCCHVFFPSHLHCDSHQLQPQPFHSVVSFTRTQPQTHMNNVSSEEIAAGWQRRWFPAAIQTSWCEGEGGSTCISNCGFVVRKESGDEEWGGRRESSCLNRSREMRAHQNADSQQRELFFGTKAKGEDGRAGRRGANWEAGAVSGISYWPASAACYNDLCVWCTFSPPVLI